MKSFSYYLLILSTVLGILSAQPDSVELSLDEQKVINICGHNYGDIEIIAAFRWINQIFFFAKNGLQFRVDYFEWDRESNTLRMGTPKALNESEWNSTSIRITFTSHYPGKGLRLIEMDLGEVCDMSVEVLIQ